MKVGRNDPCPCGSGKKYKFCHYAEDNARHLAELQAANAEATTVAEPDSDDEDASREGAEHAAGSQKHGGEHRNDRSRFQGSVRGGNSSFRPRVNRGAQRGT